MNIYIYVCIKYIGILCKHIISLIKIFSINPNYRHTKLHLFPHIYTFMAIVKIIYLKYCHSITTVH